MAEILNVSLEEKTKPILLFELEPPQVELNPHTHQTSQMTCPSNCLHSVMSRLINII